ncbi:MAG: ABC transporter substrate-binding protein [Betaproteobacteria bacterium]|nr:putative phospholipid-binding protein MlaC precursor [Ferrovum sp. PN-J185]MDE1892308.1 ABC transporter substrate-binding protein [Betaproteobacteria bacterium]MDE2056646.1 ABC transporter substrate-binding protein [Betaproteobacteria bacterium]
MVALMLVTIGVKAQNDFPSAVDTIRNTANEVINTLKADKAIHNGDRQKAYALINDKVLPHFDFVRMTRLAMGKNWRLADDNQKKELVDNFRSLLVRTYASSLSQYKDQVVQVKGSENTGDDSDVIVHTAIIPSGGDTIPIDYAMEKQADGWKVYDIRVDGVSLVTNYRGEFNEQINRGGINGLIKALEDKSRLAEKK